MLETVVFVTGIVGAIAIAFPSLVVFGLFLLVPGLIMVLAPTIFVYLALTLLFRTYLPLPAGPLSTIVCLALALALGWAVMLPWRLIERARYDALHAEDVRPPHRLSPSGHVRLEWPEWNEVRDGPKGCNHLCLALLELPNVDSLTQVRGEGGEPTTYLLGGEEAGEPVEPVTPGRLSAAFAALDREDPSPEAVRPVADGQALAAAGRALRLAGERTLRRRAVPRVGEADWTVRFVRQLDDDVPRLQRLEISDRTGTVRARASVLEHEIPARFFQLAFEGGSASSGFAERRWKLGTQRLGAHRRRAELDPDVALVRFVDFARPRIDGDELARLQEAAAEVLANPEATAQELALVSAWVTLLGHGEIGPKLPLLARVLEDRRIEVSRELLYRWLAGGRIDLSPLRRGLVRRLLRSEDPRTRETLAGLLVAMPEGTFASPTAEERTLWSASNAMPEAGPFLERIADRGGAAVPELLGRLDATIAEPGHRRRWTLRGIREAFKRLGPTAEAAIPAVRHYLSQRGSPLLEGGSARREWLVALARMGVPLDELPYHERLTAEERSTEAARVRSMVERYEKARAERHREARG